MAWPKDWPDDAKTGMKFVQEVLRRYPGGSVQIGSLEQAQQWLEKEEQPTPTPSPTPSSTSTSSPLSKFGRTESNRKV